MEMGMTGAAIGTATGTTGTGMVAGGGERA
jgi:hypothetical protein